MIEASVGAWLLWTTVMLLATAGGLAASRALPWTPRARAAGMVAAAGVALAPFLALGAAVLALLVLPGRSHGVHLGAVMIVLAVPAGLLVKGVLAKRSFFDQGGEPSCAGPLGWRRVLAVLLMAWIGGILLDTVLLPLTQNDALEYATVGRILFQERSLAAYPVMDPSLHDGFFAPWTHPAGYVSLLYLANIVQGSADMPGLMRAVAPWFTLSAAALVYAVARLHSAVAAVAAAVIFLGAPLLYLGTGGGLIDALPIGGIVLVVASVIGLDRNRPLHAGAAQGLVLGAALWTHSQAILFPALAVAAVVVWRGTGNLAGLARHLAALLACAVAVAAWPYLRNLEVHGSLISDTPQVFAFAPLRWDEYFSMGRGLASVSEKISWGLFKWWTMPEAYGIAFWVALPGVWLAVRHGRGNNSQGQTIAPGGSGADQDWLRVPLGVLAVYFLGIGLSLLLGIDLMIRNERYQLTMLPFAAVLAGVAMAQALQPLGLGDRAVRKGAWIGWRVFFAGVAAFYLVGWIAVSAHRFRPLVSSPSLMVASMEDRLSKFAAYGAARFLYDNMEPGDRVLTLKPADLYYAKRRMISYLDASLLPFYGEKEAPKAAAILAGLGVRYVHVPDYGLPVQYRSALEVLLADPALARLRHSEGGYQVYELARPKGADGLDSSVDVSPGAHPWTEQWTAVLGGRHGTLRIPLGRGPAGDGRQDLAVFGRLIAREWVTQVVLPPAASTEEQELRLDLLLRGDAFVSAHVMPLDASGQALATASEGSAGQSGRQRIGETAVAPADGERLFSRRFIVDGAARQLMIRVEHRGSRALSVVRAQLHRIDSDEEPAAVGLQR